MAVVENVRLIERRLAMLRVERDRLAHQGGSDTGLPAWAAEALVHAGLTRREIAAFNNEPAPSNDDVCAERERLNDIIYTLEQELALRTDDDLETLQAVAELALNRVDRALPTDPNDLFYDAGNRNTVALIERLVSGLKRLNGSLIRQAG